MIEMNIYYTAKDIEEMAAKGVRQLEIGPGVTLTDFARETAQQLDITLTRGDGQAPPSAPLTSSLNKATISDKYNKPAGCMHGSNLHPGAQQTATVPSDQSTELAAGSNTVNMLIDLMGKVIKRGG